MNTETEVKELIYRDKAETVNARKSPCSKKKISLAGIAATVVLAAVIVCVNLSAGSEIEVADTEQTIIETPKTDTQQEVDERALREQEFETATFTSEGDTFGGLDTSAPAYQKNTTLSVMSTDEPLEVLNTQSEEDSVTMSEEETSEQPQEEASTQDADTEETDETPATLKQDVSEEEEAAEDRRVVTDPSEFNLKTNKKFMEPLDKDEKKALEKIVEAEASGQDIYGKMLVAAVVLNRKNNSHYPDTVSGVVHQHSGDTYQFAPIKNGSFDKAKPSDSTKEAVGRVLEGEDYSEGALYFFHRAGTTKEKASWFDNKLHYLFKYGSHEFYKAK